MYKIVNIISIIIRQFVLPNPYINLFENKNYADCFNIVVGGIILHILSVLLTGFGYTRGIDEPAAGSIGYLLSYILLTFLITLLGVLFDNLWILVGVFTAIYSMLCILVKIIFNKNKLL